jgi:ABC-type branched-subunit amino acid transport system substrate-binding protein
MQETTMRRTSRRTLLTTAAGLAAATALPFRVAAQGAPFKLGVLTPLTGAGGNDGPRMLKAMEAVRQEVNRAGGVLGRPVEFVVEDDQTNPEAAVRAARKLIEVDKVPLIMGTWASAVTSAVAPVCWESKTFLMTCSGADSISLLPHQGFLVRTQPNNKLQASAHGEFVHSMGAKRVAIIGVQAPFAQPNREHLERLMKSKGGEVVIHVIYEKDKPTYRSEIDQVMRAKPDFLYTNGYAPDTVVLLRDMYKAGITLPKFAQSYAVPQKTLDTMPPEVTDGVFTGQPAADIEAKAYDLMKARLGEAEPDAYVAQANDWASLAILMIAKAKEASGVAFKDNVRKVSQGDGVKVSTAVEGLKAIAEGKEINYEGASGPCDFTDIGDIQGCRFRYMKVAKGKLEFLKLV